MVFAKKVWKLLVAIKDALALLFLLLFFGALYAVLAMRPAGGKVVDGALLLDLDGRVVEEKSQIDPVNLLLSRSAPTGEFQARDVERALRLAAKDQRIKVVVLGLSGFLGGGFVHMHDIGQAIDVVRKAGKPVLTYANIYSDDSMLLAAHASEVWVNGMGGAFVAGPGGTQMYYKGLMDRFKVKAHIYRAGTYKSYVEPYFRTDMSDPAREANNELYGALWQAWLADVRTARPKAKIDQMVSDPIAWAKASGGDFAKGAQMVGLVDRIGDEGDFNARVAQLAGAIDRKNDEDDLPYAHTDLDDWLRANPVKTDGATIGVITVAGDIVDGDAGPGNAGGDRLADLLDDHIDDGMKALVVRVDSPGGSAMAAEHIRQGLLRYKAKKIPIIVSMGNMAASGGYWVSTAGQRVFAEPGTVTGSIGVFAVIPSFEDTLKDFGVTTDGVRTTPLSGQPDVVGGFSPAVDALLQGSIESTYGKFVGIVAKARGKTPQQIDAIAQGRVWPGNDALRIGLVDQMGDLDDALAYAAKVAGLGNQPWHAQYLASKTTGWSALLGGVESRAQARSGTPSVVLDYPGFVAARQQAQITHALADLGGMMQARDAQVYCMECAALPEGAAVRQADGDWVKALARYLLN
ncbi:signal peptide peptidase SppA [Novosphingobium sp. 9]|uniref:signal peptide peptidase SppA n=1 Tax=Novosphingobium sp. 9 TaxID=2025349 RepID=UPI0021B5C766|nr:signal peptide peptidase SppA [Novosphingobium sp. 9]